MIWVYNMSWLWVDGIVLWPFVLMKPSKKQASESLINHEKKHVEQVYRHWIIGFYVLYVYHYFRLRMNGITHEDAYLSNPFEIEARRAE